ncbi:MAG: glycerol-3-phosphate acyltransferase [Puniceicoccales bacterium]|nr:glycerol-3-phosphate acyltransferase [Puniceicoccales bacterium]
MVGSAFFYVLAPAVGYFLGAIPFGYLVARVCGVHILSVGSGNIGATNVKRTVGSLPGAVVLALDIAKGYLAAGWPIFAVRGAIGQRLGLLGLLGALLGHMFSPFLRFRGGKGVAVAIGGCGATMANVLPLALLTWMMVFWAGRFVSLASLAFALMVPLCTYLFGYSLFACAVTVAMALFIFLRHLPNLRRLLAGTELRFGRGGSER